jgi:hypothetical protein
MDRPAAVGLSAWLAGGCHQVGECLGDRGWRAAGGDDERQVEAGGGAQPHADQARVLDHRPRQDGEPEPGADERHLNRRVRHLDADRPLHACPGEQLVGDDASAPARCEVDERLVGQFADRDDLPAGERVIGRAAEQHRVGGQRGRRQPETVSRPQPRPAWHPQRVAIPADRRGTFFAAATGAAAGTAAQIAVGRVSVATTMKTSLPVLFAGLALFSTAMWLPSLPVFVIGGIVTGAGGGLVIRGSLIAAAATAPPQSRAEVLAGFFLGAYIGLSAPVIALGIATQYATARDVMPVFVALAAVAVAAGARAVLRRQQPR